MNFLSLTHGYYAINMDNFKILCWLQQPHYRITVNWFVNEYLFTFVSNAQIVGNKAKGRISKRVFQENKARQIFRKMNISYPLIRTRTCAYQGVRNVRFFGKFNVLCFLEIPDLRFALLPYYRRNYVKGKKNKIWEVSQTWHLCISC